MAKGYVETSVTKCLIIGAAGVGKTHLKHLLLMEEPPKKRVSTGVADNPVRAVSCTLTGVREGEDKWFTVNNEELLEMIGAAIKHNEISIKTQTNEMIEGATRDGKMIMTQLNNEEVLQTHETFHEFTAEMVQNINRSTGKTMFIVIIS